MRRVHAAALMAALFAASAAAGRAQAGVRIEVSRASQTMDVFVDGDRLYTWRVSTARPGYRTPVGTFHPHMLARRWFSRVYDNSPMPYSIFFYYGFAIHGSYEIARIGRPASHGCIRLNPADAAILFGLVQREGMRNTIVVVQ